MEELLTEFLINGIGVALVLSSVLCGVIRFALGPQIGTKLAGAAIAVAFLITYANLFGWPDFPPRSATQKIGYLVLLGLIAGVALDMIHKPHLTRPALIVFPAVIVGWIGWRNLTGFNVDGLLMMGGLWIAGAFILTRLQATAQSSSSHAAVLVLAASVGMAIITFLGAAASQAQLMGLLAASAGGYLLWNWPTPRLAFSNGAIFGAGGALLAVSTTILLYSDASQLAMVFIVPVFLVPVLLARNPIVNRPALGALVIGGMTLMPVAVAAGIAVYFMEGNS